MVKTRVLSWLLSGLLLLCPASAWGGGGTAALGEMARVCLAELPDGQLGQAMLEFFAQTEEWMPSGLSYEMTAWDESAGWRAMEVSVATEGESLPLFTIRFSREDEVLRLPEASIRRALSDEAYVLALIRCHEQGIPVRVDFYEQRVTEGGMVSFWVAAYEAIAGGAIETGALTAWPEAPQTARKALQIGLLEQEEGWHPEPELEPLRSVDLWNRWQKAVADQVGRRGAEPMIDDLFITLMNAVERQLNVETSVSGETFGMPMTRERYAQRAVPAFWAAFGDRVDEETLWLPELDDTEDAVLRQSVALSLVDPVTPPDTEWLYFEGERELTVLEVLDLLAQWNRRALNYLPVEPALTWEKVLPGAQALLQGGTVLGEKPNIPQRVENERPYEWYARQEDTGPYSANNCMPAATAMTLRWVREENDLTVQQLRDMAPMQGMGWYPQQVQEIFEQYHVDYTTPPISLSGMLEALDAGHILFVLLNEGAYGHCLIVKGYIREGAGLWMLTYDPASPTLDPWGQYIGKNRRIEAGELIRAMENHWWLYFDIVGEAVD